VPLRQSQPISSERRPCKSFHSKHDGGGVCQRVDWRQQRTHSSAKRRRPQTATSTSLCSIFVPRQYRSFSVGAEFTARREMGRYGDSPAGEPRG